MHFNSRALTILFQLTTSRNCLYQLFNLDDQYNACRDRLDVESHDPIGSTADTGMSSTVNRKCMKSPKSVKRYKRT